MPIRQRTIRFIQQSGVTQIYIVRTVGIPKSTWRYFIAGERRLPPKYYADLDCFLARYGY